MNTSRWIISLGTIMVVAGLLTACGSDGAPSVSASGSGSGAASGSASASLSSMERNLRQLALRSLSTVCPAAKATLRLG
jgi:hypothetical protein